MIFLALLVLLHDSPAVKPKKAYIIPVSLEDEADPRTFLSSVEQIEIDQDLLYIRPSNAAAIQVYNRDRKFLFYVGSQGEGPGEFKTIISGFSVSDAGLWAFERDEKMSYFQGDKYIRDIPIKGVQVSIFRSSTAAFASDDNLVLLSAHPKTRRLGIVYAHDGTVLQGVGDIFPINEEDLRKNPAYNDVLWVKGGSHWYAVFEYHPLIQRYDENFKLVTEFSYDTQAVQEFEERWEEWKPKKGWRIPFEMNRDAKWYGGHLWVLCDGALLKFNPKTEQLVGAWHFFGKGTQFKNNGRLHFYSFDFFSDGQLIMATTDDGWGSHIFTSQL